MKPELNTLLWITGMAFSLGIFSIKVGLGLGFSRAGAKQVAFTYGGYLIMFLFFSAVANRVVSVLDPLLKKGPYIHAFVAVGFISWAIYVLITTGRYEHGEKNRKKTSLMLLVVPCPVCITAMAYSTWAAVWMTKASPVTIGFLLAGIFLGISTVFLFASRLAKDPSGTGLAISLFVIGAYFLLSLVVPSIVQEAKGIYSSFTKADSELSMSKDTIGVFLIMVSAIGAGYIIGTRRKR